MDRGERRDWKEYRCESCGRLRQEEILGFGKKTAVVYGGEIRSRKTPSRKNQKKIDQ